MADTISTIFISPPDGARHKKKRKGRGEASGHGKTSCRGGKGQTARAGKKLRPGFEGGQLPLIRRIPKTGFKNYFTKDVKIVNVGQLNDKFNANDSVDLSVLQTTGLIKFKKSSNKQFVKILGEGELKKPLKVSAHFFSKSAVEKIKNAGGETLELKTGGKG